MASRGKKVKAAVPFSPADVAHIAKSNPYIQRLIEDADLRENVQKAIESSKKAYGRLSNGKAPHKALLEDKKLQKDLQEALDAIRDCDGRTERGAEEAGQEGPPVRSPDRHRRPRRRARARHQRKAPLEGARHAVRCRGGVRVHATGNRPARHLPRPRSARRSRSHIRVVQGRPQGALGVFGEVLERFAHRHSGCAAAPGPAARR